MTDFIESGKRTIQMETDAVRELSSRIGVPFVTACKTILSCEGRVVVIGMGKSGHIGNKIAATLASTGTPAFFVHPGEASHGDLGMITKGDVVIAISNSGNTNEILTLIPLIIRLGIPLISMTGDDQSQRAVQGFGVRVLIQHQIRAPHVGATASRWPAVRGFLQSQRHGYAR